jgi:cell division protein FtsZ
MEFNNDLLDFGPMQDKSKNIIKVIGVGGGGCNAVRNMYNEGIINVTFAVCNTDSQSLSKSPVPVKIQLGDTGLGAGANPEKGREAAAKSIENIKNLLDDGTKMVFVTAGMGGGTGTGAAPVIASVAKEKGILTVGIVTIPFSFEKKQKIIKALKGVEEMRKNVDALLIVNNERLCDIYADTKVTIKDAFRRADQILSNATKSISELITVEGDINLDFCDVETTLRSGGGAIMAMGRANGEHRVEKAIIDALDSPLLYGNDIDKAKRILFNIYTSEKAPLYVREMQQIDAFMDELNPNIEVIWGVSDDNTLEEDAKITILATGFEDFISTHPQQDESNNNIFYEKMMIELYHSKIIENPEAHKEIPFTVETGIEEQTNNISDENDEIDSIDTEKSIDKDLKFIEEAETKEQESSEKETTSVYQNQTVNLSDTTSGIPPTQNEISPKTHHMTFVERVKKKMFDIAIEMTSDERNN